MPIKTKAKNKKTAKRKIVTKQKKVKKIAGSHPIPRKKVRKPALKNKVLQQTLGQKIAIKEEFTPAAAAALNEAPIAAVSQPEFVAEEKDLMADQVYADNSENEDIEDIFADFDFDESVESEIAQAPAENVVVSQHEEVQGYDDNLDNLNNEELAEEESYEEDEPIEEIELVESGPLSKMNDHQRHIVMYVCISLIMTVIVGFWLFSVKNSLGKNLEFSASDSQPVVPNNIQNSLDDFINSFNSTQDDLTGEVNTLKQTVTNSQEQLQQQILEARVKQEAANKTIEKLQAEAAATPVAQPTPAAVPFNINKP